MKWEKVSLRDYTTKIGSGVTPKGGASVYQDDGVALFRSQNIYNGSFFDKGLAFINEVIAEKMKSVEVLEGDVLLNITGDSVARCCYAPVDFLPGRVNQHVAIVRADKEKLHSKFLMYQLISPFMQNTMLSYAEGAGATRNALTKGIIEDLQINLPPLPTQRKIASILSAYDNLIENNLKRIKLLEEKASLMYKLMQKELSDVEKINLYDFANIQMGFAFKAEAFNVEGEGIPIIRIRDIPAQMTKSHTTQEVDNQYWVEKGDLLIGMDGEFHMNEWLGQRGYLVQRVCRLRAKNELYQSYLWQALKEPIHYYETTISGATVAHLGKKHLEEIFIASPKDSMKNELEEMNVMRKLKIVLAEQNTKLREARDILLPKLMNGQIEV